MAAHFGVGHLKRSEMSPELDLLERLSALDANLHECAFGSVYTFRNLGHAKQVVSLYLKSDIVELFDQSTSDKRTLPFYECRLIIGDNSNWNKGTNYYLRITDKGYEQFQDDSTGFFDRLFSE